MAAGRVDDAIVVCRRMIDLDNYWFAHQLLGEAYLQKGMASQAIPELEKAVELRGGGDNAVVNIKGVLAKAYVIAGQPDRARRIAADFEAQAKTGNISAWGPIIAYLALGDHEHALAWLQQSYERHGAMMMMLNQKMFDPLRSDPRFQDLVRRVGLPRKDQSARTSADGSAR